MREDTSCRSITTHSYFSKKISNDESGDETAADGIFNNDFLIKQKLADMRGRLVSTSWESDICALAAFVKLNDLIHTGWTSCLSHPGAFSKTCCTGSCQASQWMEAPAIFLIRVSIRFPTSDTSDL